MKYTVEIRATSYTISPGSEAMDDLEELLDVLTYEDEFAEQTKTLGYLYDEPSDCLYIHKGVDPQYLKRLIPNSQFIDVPYHPYDEMKFEYEEIIAPRNDEQSDVIDFICGKGGHSSNLGASQIFLVKQPGFG